MFAVLWVRQEGTLLYRTLILLFALQATLMGLNLGYHINIFKHFQVVNAASIPLVAYWGFISLKQSLIPFNFATHKQYIVQALPVFVVAFASFYFPVALDILLTSIFCLYGVLILKMTTENSDFLVRLSLDAVNPTLQSWRVIAILLIVMGIIDLIVMFDLDFLSGKSAYFIISLTNGAVILILCFSVMQMSNALDQDIELQQPILPENTANASKNIVEMSAQECQTTFEHIQGIVTRQQLFHDPDLNLAKLARKVSTPSRKVSISINTMTGLNVSQYINQFRIEAATHLLETTNESIMTIMFAVGFQTKSNFNREFSRLKLVSPSEWRKQHQPK